MNRKTLTARTLRDLLDRIYKVEGWTRAFGESPTARAKTLYDLTINHKTNRFIATPK